MGGLPSDLLPIPTQPWDERPNELPLDVEEVRTALWVSKGNISQAAASLKVNSSRLRNFVNNKPRLVAEQKEARERLADRAEEIVDEALNDNADAGRRDSMARYILNSRMARERGISAAPGATVNIKNQGPMSVTWMAPNTLPEGALKTIDESGNLVDD